jgi:hypothetical protein
LRYTTSFSSGSNPRESDGRRKDISGSLCSVLHINTIQAQSIRTFSVGIR